MYPVFAGGLLVAHDANLTFALQVLHNVVYNAKFHMVETSSTSALSGDSPVNIDQVLDSKGLLAEFLSHFLLPKVVLVTALFSFNVYLHKPSKSL